jgi:hypothetical protein
MYGPCHTGFLSRARVAINMRPYGHVSTDGTSMAGPRSSGTGHGQAFRVFYAEGVGLEPMSRGHPLAVFKSARRAALTSKFPPARDDATAYLP